MAKSRTYQTRFYRGWINRQGLATFEVQVGETDLQIRARCKLVDQARRLATTARGDIESYAARVPRFITSLSPLPIRDPCPPVVQAMLAAGQAYDVGPMAAVAGAIAEAVGRGLLSYSDEVIVENGGDIWLSLPRPAVLSVYCGVGSPFSHSLRLRVDGRGRPLGICTSSGTVGHSLSFGRADAVVAVAEDAALADAAATAICNRIQKPEDIQPVLEAEQKRGLLLGMVAVMGKYLAAWGAVELNTAD